MDELRYNPPGGWGGGMIGSYLHLKKTKKNPTYFLNVQRWGHRSVLTTVQWGLYWHLAVLLLADTIIDPHWTADIQYGHTTKTKRWTITTAFFFLFVCFFITLAERGKYCSFIFETQVLITSTWNWAFFFWSMHGGHWFFWEWLLIHSVRFKTGY